MLNEILDQYMRTLRKKNHVCCVVLQKNHNKNIIISEPHTHIQVTNGQHLKKKRMKLIYIMYFGRNSHFRAFFKVK